LRNHRLGILVGLIVALNCWFSGSQASAATPNFTVSATNSTMPGAGFGSIPITITSVDGYTGTITVNCGPTNPPVGAKLPICGGPTAPPVYKLTANASVNGSITLMPFGDDFPTPASLPRPSGHGRATSLALAGLVLLGMGLRRRGLPLLGLALFAAVSLAGMSGCAAGGNGMTPGTYSYAINAGDINTGAYVSTSVQVTVK
jgi:hypothetical protein